MSGITAVSIDASVSIEDVELKPTYIEVKRRLQQTPAHAKVKGYTQDIGDIALDQKVTVNINGERIFTGILKEAKLNQKKEVIIHAYDSMIDLFNTQVRMNTESPRFANEVARDLFEKAGFDVADRSANPNEISEGEVYVAPGRKFPKGDTRADRQYGSGKNGERMMNVLRDLTDKLGGVFWVDQRNRIRIEPFPENILWDLQNIMEMNTGKNTEDKKTVIVKGGSPGSELGAAGTYMYDQSAITSKAGLRQPPGEEEDTEIEEGKIEVVRDKTISSQKEANKTAVTKGMKRKLDAEAGTIKVSGDPAFELLDIVKVPQLEFDFPGTFSTQGKNIDSTLLDNKYTIGEIEHVVDKQKGYTTMLTLGLNAETALNGMKGPAVQKLKEEFLEDIRRRKETDVGATNNAGGFTSTPAATTPGGGTGFTSFE